MKARLRVLKFDALAGTVASLAQELDGATAYEVHVLQSRIHRFHLLNRMHSGEKWHARSRVHVVESPC